MASTSAILPTSAMEHGDIRSASVPFKRNKDQVQKWSRGGRPRDIELNFGDVANPRSQPGKLRPEKLPSQTRGYTSVFQSPKAMSPSGDWGYQPRHTKGTLHRKAQSVSVPKNPTSPLSRSLLDLPPQHSNNTIPAIRTASNDGFLYSFDNKGPSPFQKASSVELSGLVEKAEKRWVNEQTERIVKGEYEVLDEQGEVVKRKKKGSPRQNAVKERAKIVADEDDDFELV